MFEKRKRDRYRTDNGGKDRERTSEQGGQHRRKEGTEIFVRYTEKNGAAIWGLLEEKKTLGLIDGRTLRNKRGECLKGQK